MSKSWIGAHFGLSDALRWISFIAFLVCVYFMYAQEAAPFQSQIRPWREVATVDEVQGDLSEAAGAWLRAFTENRSHIAALASQRPGSLSPTGNSVRTVRAQSLASDGPERDLMFSRAGAFNRELRLLRLKERPSIEGVIYQWRWTEDGKKLLVFGAGASEEPALIVYDIQQNEILRIRPEHRWRDWQQH